MLEKLGLCVPKTLSGLVRQQNRLNWRGDRANLVCSDRADLAVQVETDRAGDALGQCEIPLGPNWLFWFNRQRGVQLGH